MLDPVCVIYLSGNKNTWKDEMRVTKLVFSGIKVVKEIGHLMNLKEDSRIVDVGEAGIDTNRIHFYYIYDKGDVERVEISTGDYTNYHGNYGLVLFKRTLVVLESLFREIKTKILHLVPDYLFNNVIIIY